MLYCDGKTQSPGQLLYGSQGQPPAGRSHRSNERPRTRFGGAQGAGECHAGFPDPHEPGILRHAPAAVCTGGCQYSGADAQCHAQQRGPGTFTGRKKNLLSQRLLHDGNYYEQKNRIRSDLERRD